MIRASSSVLDKCMARNGFDGYHTPIPANLKKNQYSDAIPDLAVLKSNPNKMGYGIEKKLSSQDVSTQVDGPLGDPYLKKLSQSELQRLSTVMWGTKIITVRSATGGFVNVRADGCAHEADSAVYQQGWEELDIMRDGLLSTAMANTYANTSFASALAAWKTCMATAGISADRPGLLRSSLEQEYSSKAQSTAVIFEKEKSVAEVDFECQKSSKYNSIAIPTLITAMKNVIAEHALELAELKRIELQAVKNSKKILGTSK